MSKMEQEFSELLLDDGALSRLSNAVIHIRLLLSELPLNREQSNRLIHYGLPGEYFNGIGLLHPLEHLTRSKPDEYPPSRLPEHLISSLSKPSHLSEFDRAFKGETAFTAIPRAVKEVFQFMAKNHEAIPPDSRDALNLSLQECEKSFAEVQAFAQKYQDCSPA